MSNEELKAIGIAAYLVKPVKQSRLFDSLVNAMGNAQSEAVFVKSAGSRPPLVPPHPAYPQIRMLPPCS
jgi:hypothetical protein